MGIASIYKRWRHTRGYGVHSPFAYSIVKEVIRPARGYAYYGYEDIDSLNGGDIPMRQRAMARMLLRLACLLKTKKVFMTGQKGDSPFRCALRAVNSRISVVTDLKKIDECDLITSSGASLPLELLAKLLQQPGRTLCVRNVPDGWREKLMEDLPEGVMFIGRRNLIAVHRKDLRKVSYTVLI